MQSVTGGMYEPESIRLQREVDEFTHRLEHEKSHLNIIEEQIKQIQSELEERQANVEALKPTPLQSKKTHIEITRNNKQINNERIRLNMTKAQNEQLRKQIDMLRKELTSSKDECFRYERNIKKSKREAELQNKDYQIVSKIAEETRNQIIALQAKTEDERRDFDKQIQNLQTKLKEKEEIIEIEDNKADKNKDNELSKGSDFSNPIVILKRRLLKIVETNKEKRRLMDQYLRNVKVIEDAFDQIKQATGISNIEEIVTTFIKAEEQNYSLYNYVNMLGTETVQLEEANEEIKEQIQKIVERGQLSDQERINLEKSLSDEAELLQTEIQNK